MVEGGGFFFEATQLHFYTLDMTHFLSLCIHKNYDNFYTPFVHCASFGSFRVQIGQFLITVSSPYHRKGPTFQFYYQMVEELYADATIFAIFTYSHML